MYETNIEKIKKAQNGSKQEMEEIMNNNSGLIWSIVKRFLGRGYGKEELYQIGCIGLIKAVKRFDNTYNVKISTFAVPYIMGEIKRFLRDDGPIKVSRSIKELGTKIAEVQRDYFVKNGEEIKISELARVLNVGIEDISVALEAAKPIDSIDENIYDEEDGQNKITKISDNKDDFGKLIDKMTLSEIIKELDEREKEIIILRYFKEKTQTEVAKILRHITSASF